MDNTIVSNGRRSGLRSWLLSMWKLQRLRDRSMRQMQLLEILPVGGKRQLALVRCGSGQFLVGMGAETVSTITRVDSSESEQV